MASFSTVDEFGVKRLDCTRCDCPQFMNSGDDSCAYCGHFGESHNGVNLGTGVPQITLVETSGVPDFSHPNAVLGHPRPNKIVRLCGLEGCNRECFEDFDYCCKTHGREAKRRQEARTRRSSSLALASTNSYMHTSQYAKIHVLQSRRLFIFCNPLRPTWYIRLISWLWEKWFISLLVRIYSRWKPSQPLKPRPSS